MGRPYRTDEESWQGFLALVEKTDTCWLWLGNKTPDGYGALMRTHNLDKPKKYMAHRFSYLKLVGPIPEGLQIDHLCRVRHCVNPDHLEPVTNKENIRRGIVGMFHAKKTQCPAGHPYDRDNTRIGSNGSRNCKQCDKIRQALYRARKKGVL